MSWGKMPSQWLRPIPMLLPPGASKKPGGPPLIYPLTTLEWRKDGSSSMAALMILIALSLRLNKWLRTAQMDPRLPRPTTIAVTYDELQRMTGFARAPVSTGIELLKEMGAISAVKVGRANHYELLGINENGKWCQVPQQKLLREDGTLSIKTMERKRMTLYALKLYVALMALRNQQYNTAALSYSGITRWTGIRRADVGPAIQLLIAWELVDVSEDMDERGADDEDKSNRYRIRGLKKIIHGSEVV